MSARTEQAQPVLDPLSLRRIAARLPLTVQPSVVQQLNEWPMLFPFERNRLIRFLNSVDTLDATELAELAAPLKSVENKMGVAHWNFSTTRNTMENSGQLARSEYYGEWRLAVDQFMSGIDARSASIAHEPTRHTLVVIVLPDNLPVLAETAWGPWKSEGTTIPIRGDASSICELLLRGRPPIGASPMQHSNSESSDTWVIDAEVRPEKEVGPDLFASVSCLRWALFEPFRARFLAELNAIPKDIHTASQNMTALQQKDWSRWWPAELAGHDRLKNFMVELYLSGNGALIFSNAFVEWAAAEALRRARPRVLIARFGMRNKPKPFTSIAIFENQSLVSAVPDVPDPENSAVDAAMLAHYIWLRTLRYQEYEQALCLCVAEHLNAVRLIAPAGSGLETLRGVLSPGEVHAAALRWLAS